MQSPYPVPQTGYQGRMQDHSQPTDTATMDLGRVVLIYV